MIEEDRIGGMVAAAAVVEGNTGFQVGVDWDVWWRFDMDRPVLVGTVGRLGIWAGWFGWGIVVESRLRVEKWEWDICFLLLVVG